jgi:AcrR family transcriptional regulator
VIREEGFAQLGINRIARIAGVSKVLIYRYFKSLDGLIEQWLLANNYWSGRSKVIEKHIRSIPSGERAGSDLHKMMVTIFRGQTEQLRSSFEVREMLRWFLCQESSLTRSVMKDVEESGSSLTRAFIETLESTGDLSLEGADSEAIVALIISGLYYLALISDRVDRFNGVPLDSDEGWERINRAIELISKNLIKGETEK